MATYIMLGNFTEQGIRNVTDAPKRADAFKELAKSKGVIVKEFFWLMGEYDMLVIAEAPDDAAISAAGLAVAKLGNVRSRTMRGFTASEFAAILAKA